MKRLLIAAILVAAATGTFAQTSMPAPGKGMQDGPGKTAGWALMTDAERKEHREKMASLTSQDDCMAYMKDHHTKMEARAKEQGKALPAEGPADGACKGMKGMKGMKKGS